MKQDYAINADYNIGDLSTNHSFLLNGKPIEGKTYVGDETTIHVDDDTNVISVKDGGITSDKITDGAVTADKIADGAVTTNKIAENAITSDKIVDGAITDTKLADGAVNSDKLSNLFDKSKVTLFKPSTLSLSPIYIVRQLSYSYDTSLTTEPSCEYNFYLYNNGILECDIRCYNIPAIGQMPIRIAAEPSSSNFYNFTPADKIIASKMTKFLALTRKIKTTPTDTNILGNGFPYINVRGDEFNAYKIEPDGTQITHLTAAQWNHKPSVYSVYLKQNSENENRFLDKIIIADPGTAFTAGRHVWVHIKGFISSYNEDL